MPTAQTAADVIPPITDPLGRGWNQPALAEVLMDEHVCMMTHSTFKRMPEYSGTLPTGVYPGKMFRFDAFFRTPGKLHNGHRHWLRWFGESENPGKVSCNERPIISEHD